MVLHSDRGSQYTSQVFRTALKQYGAIQSMSSTGRCYDNARMESFFATLKKEKLYKNNTKNMTIEEGMFQIPCIHQNGYNQISKIKRVTG
jgi:transposase InsO family protein